MMPRSAVAAVWFFSQVPVALLSGQSGPGSQHQAPALQDSVRHLYRSDYSRARFPLRAVVRDSAAFSSVWREVVGDTVPPKVDFTKFMVVVATLGPKGSDIYDIRVRVMDSVPIAVRIHVDVSSPSVPMCQAGAGILTSPADVALVPLTYRVVTFVDRYVGIRC